MTLEEAIIEVKMIIICLEEWFEIQPANKLLENSIDALKIILNEAKKQIPGKPIIKNWSPALCPNCCGELSEHIGDGYYKHHESLKFCVCGQKLEWGD